MNYKINWKGVLLWSNQFYGICAVSLSMESSYIVLHKIPSIALLLLIHLATVLYYTHAYLFEQKEGIYNDRTLWYRSHKNYLIFRQIFLSAVVIYLSFIQLGLYHLFIKSNLFPKAVVLITVAFLFLYYLPSIATRQKNNIRENGIIKSLSIAWVWSFVVCYFPIWLISKGDSFAFSAVFLLHFIELFLFMLILAILFDIKDINRDQVEKVNTIAVTIGKDHVVQKIILPLLLLYSICILIDWHLMSAPNLVLYTQAILVTMVYWIARLALKRKDIYINILLIDGLMIFKVILSIFVFLK